MGGFADLNSFSEEPIEFTDNRAANVIFSNPIAEDQAFDSLEFVFPVTRPYDIEEIIRPDVALVSYSIDVSGVPGVTVAWNTVPAGSTVTVNNGVYTINGIDDIAEWDIVKDPTITVPTSFQGSLFYTVSVNYTTADGPQTYQWQVGVYIPAAYANSEFTLAASVARLQPLGEITIVGGFTFRTDLSVTIEPAVFPATTSLTAVGKIDRALDIQPRYVTSIMAPVDAEVIHPWRYYETPPFVNTNSFGTVFGNYRFRPAEQDLLGNWTSVRQVVTVESGRIIHSDGVYDGFSRTVGTSYDDFDIFRSNGYTTFDATTFRNNTGPYLYLDPLVSKLYFVPEYNHVGNVNFNFKVYVDGVLRTDYDSYIRVGDPGFGQPINAPREIIDVYDSSYSTSYPTWKSSAYAAELHNRLDVYIVGGGGAGAGEDVSNPGGGDGGDINIITGIPLTSTTSFSFTFGAGGISSDGNGTAGTASTATINGVTYTASGGAGGFSNSGTGQNGANYASMPSSARNTAFAQYAGQGNIISFDPSQYPGVSSTFRGAGGYPNTVGRGGPGSRGIVVTRTYRV